MAKSCLRPVIRQPDNPLPPSDLQQPGSDIQLIPAAASALDTTSAATAMSLPRTHRGCEPRRARRGPKRRAKRSARGRRSKNDAGAAEHRRAPLHRRATAANFSAFCGRRFPEPPSNQVRRGVTRVLRAGVLACQATRPERTHPRSCARHVRLEPLAVLEDAGMAAHAFFM